MNCPECNEDMPINDFQEDYDEDFIWLTWYCTCPKCGYKGHFVRHFKETVEYWEEDEK